MQGCSVGVWDKTEIWNGYDTGPFKMYTTVNNNTSDTKWQVRVVAFFVFSIRIGDVLLL